MSRDSSRYRCWPLHFGGLFSWVRTYMWPMARSVEHCPIATRIRGEHYRTRARVLPCHCRRQPGPSVPTENGCRQAMGAPNWNSEMEGILSCSKRRWFRRLLLLCVCLWECDSAAWREERFILWCNIRWGRGWTQNCGSGWQLSYAHVWHVHETVERCHRQQSRTGLPFQVHFRT